MVDFPQILPDAIRNTMDSVLTLGSGEKVTQCFHLILDCGVLIMKILSKKFFTFLHLEVACIGCVIFF